MTNNSVNNNSNAAMGITSVAEQKNTGQSNFSWEYYSSNLFAATFCGTVYYPFLRAFLEHKIICLNPKHNISEFRNFASNIKQKGGFFCGYNSFIASKIFPLTLISILGTNPISSIIMVPISLVISYPLYLNSNIKAYKLPGYASLKSFADLKELYTHKSNYKGLWYFLLSEFSIIIPFVNYFSHRFETIRLAYVFGPYLGHDFKDLKEAKLYLKNNIGFNVGRGYYNFYLHVINIVTFFSILNSAQHMLQQQENNESADANI